VSPRDHDVFARGLDPDAYDHRAEAFERLAQLQALPFARRVAELAGIRAGDHVLDVGCGSGLVTFEAVARVGAAGRVTGVDLSEGLLARARERAEREGVAARVDLRLADAHALPLPDSSIDAVVSLYAFMHFDRPDVATAEACRVLRPGGRVVIGIGSAPVPWSAAGLAQAARRLAFMAREASGRCLVAPEPLEKVLDAELGDLRAAAGVADHGHRGTSSRNLAALVRRAGLRVLGTDWRYAVDTFATAEDFYEAQVTFSSRARPLLVAAGPERAARVRASFLDRCRIVTARGGELVRRHGAFLVVGQRPA
jgi:SAM-dependent methyltransferase